MLCLIVGVSKLIQNKFGRFCFFIFFLPMSICFYDPINLYYSVAGEKAVYAQRCTYSLESNLFWLTCLPNGWLIRYIHANGASMCAGKTRRKVFFFLSKAHRLVLFLFSPFLGSLSQKCSVMRRYESISPVQF